MIFHCDNVVTMITCALDALKIKEHLENGDELEIETHRDNQPHSHEANH